MILWMGYRACRGIADGVICSKIVNIIIIIATIIAIINIIIIMIIMIMIMIMTIIIILIYYYRKRSLFPVFILYIERSL